MKRMSVDNVNANNVCVENKMECAEKFPLTHTQTIMCSK